MKKIISKIINTLFLLFLTTGIEAQVKTKIFFNKIPQSRLGISKYKLSASGFFHKLYFNLECMRAKTRRDGKACVPPGWKPANR